MKTRITLYFRGKAWTTKSIYKIEAQNSEPTRVAFPLSNGPSMEGRVQEDVGTGSDATRSAVGVHGMKSESADVSPREPSGDRNVIARKRGRSEKDDLLDSKQKTGSQEDRGMVLAQDTIGSEQVEGSGGQGPLEDVLGAAPPGGVVTAPPGALDTSPASSHSQPASQPTDLRMPSKNSIV